MGMLIANIFIRTWIIGEKSYVSMQSRCYDGNFNTMDDHDNLKVDRSQKFSGTCVI